MLKLFSINQGEHRENQRDLVFCSDPNFIPIKTQTIPKLFGAVDWMQKAKFNDWGTALTTYIIKEL